MQKIYMQFMRYADYTEKEVNEISINDRTILELLLSTRSQTDRIVVRLNEIYYICNIFL